MAKKRKAPRRRSPRRRISGTNDNLLLVGGGLLLLYLVSRPKTPTYTPIPGYYPGTVYPPQTSPYINLGGQIVSAVDDIFGG